jgi:hypothetical protein
MKFKSQHMQNQLIENITFNHIVVGVDIAQEAHVARVVNFRGVALGNPLVFSNDEDGFMSLDRWIRDLLASILFLKYCYDFLTFLQVNITSNSYYFCWFIII